MKSPDLDKERSEEQHSLAEFLTLYNESLPLTFPRASTTLLTEFRSTHPDVFKSHDTWSLELHRKRVMDWLQLAASNKTFYDQRRV
jgi:hypothetical protein